MQTVKMIATKVNYLFPYLCAVLGTLFIGLSFYAGGFFGYKCYVGAASFYGLCILIIGDRK